MTETDVNANVNEIKSNQIKSLYQLSACLISNDDKFVGKSNFLFWLIQYLFLRIGIDIGIDIDIDIGIGITMISIDRCNGYVWFAFVFALVFEFLIFDIVYYIYIYLFRGAHAISGVKNTFKTALKKITCLGILTHVWKNPHT